MVYLLSLTLPLVTLNAFYSETPWVILFPLIGGFVITPLLDLVPIKMGQNMGSKLIFDLVLYTGCFLYFFNQAASNVRFRTDHEKLNDGSKLSRP